MNNSKTLVHKVLTTERFVLHPVSEEHKSLIYQILSNQEVRDSIRLPTLTGETEYDEWWKLRWRTTKENTLLQWCAFLKEDQSFCALITIKEINLTNRRGEIGYSILPEYWRKGYGSELVTEAVRYGFQELDLHTFFAQILSFNIGSQRIVNKLGFSKEAHFRDMHMHKECFYDILQFSKINPLHTQDHN